MTEKQTKTPEKFIDIDGVIKDRNPSLYRVIPRFIIRYFSENIFRESDLNTLLIDLKDLNNFEFCSAFR